LALLWFCPANWSQIISPDQLEEKLKEAEKSYSTKDYLKAEVIFQSLSESFPTDPRFSYFQFMIAKCKYGLKDYSSAKKEFRDFIHQFPRSRFLPACYFMLGNIAFLQGERFESAQNFIYAHQLAGTEKLKLLARRSLEPLLRNWLSEKELKKLSETNKDKELAPPIFFWSGKRNLERGNYREAFEALSYYRDNFPHGEDIQKVYLLLQEASSPPPKTIKVGVLAPLTGDFSVYGTSLLNGIELALGTYSPTKRKVELKIKDTQGDFVKAVQLCQELIEKDNAVSVIGPLRSESAAGVAVVAEYSKIPLITPTASKRDLASLGDFVFQLSPSPQNKGKSLAEFVLQDQNLEDFVMLIPEEGSNRLEALSFEETVEKLGGKILAVEYYPPGTQDFSPYLREIKNILLGSSFPSPLEEEGSFFDQIPVWVDGFFVLADQKEMYDILSHMANFNIYATIIGSQGCGNQQVLEFAQILDRKMIFTSDVFPHNDNPQRPRFLQLYFNQYGKEPDRVSMLGYDAMILLLSILENFTSPEGIRNALLKTHGFEGASGEIHFDPQGENVFVPIFKLDNGVMKRVR